MPRTKQKVNTSWAGRYAREASNRRFLDEIESYDRDLLREIQASADRTARIQYDIDEMRADRAWREADPEGYFYEKEQRELESKPKTVANYLKNWWASLGRKQNDFQAEDFQGYMDRSDEWERLANSMKHYFEIQDEIDNLNSQLAQWRLNTQNVGKAPIEEMRKAYGAIDVLETLKNALQQELAKLEPDVEAFKSYIPNSIKARYYDAVAGNGENGIFSNNAIFGRTSQVHDELGDITRFTSSMFSPKRTRAEQKAMLDKALAAKQEKYKEWEKGYKANIEDRESYNKVDRWFKQREDKAGTDIFNSDTWLYGMPGLIAGSTSGLSKIVPAVLTGIGTGLLTGGLGAGAAWLATAAGTGATFAFNNAAGVSENNAEVAMAYSERIKDYLQNQKGSKGTLYDDVIAEGRKKLGLESSAIDDDQVFERFRRGDYTINNATANKKMHELAVGIESQFQDDMAATTWSAGLETALQIVPFGRLLKPAKPLLYKVLRSTLGEEAIKKGAAATLAKGYELGSIASPIGGMIYAPVHLAMSPARKYVGKGVANMLDDIAKSSIISENIPKELLKKKFASSTKAKYFKDITGRWAVASAAEGVEEGKQHISADRYKSGYYTDAKIKSIGETILDDFLAGSKSAGLLLGMPFEDAMSEKDREILQEIKGGFILGGLQTAVVNTSQSIAPFVSEQKATTAIVNSVLLDKAAKVDQLNKARIYAEAAKSSSAFQNMLNGFDRLRQANKDQYDASGEYGINPDAIDDEEKQFRKVASMSTDGFTIKQAKAQGIEPGSQEYNNFVATKALVTSELEDAQEVSKLAGENLQQAVTAAMEPFLTAQLKRESAAIPGAQVEDEEEGSPVAQFTSAENFNQLNNVAQYSVLLKMKDQLELGIVNAQAGGHKKTEKILMKLLTTVNDRINNLKPVIDKYTNEDETIDVNNLESVETKLALDKEMHDKLTEAYRQQFVADQDLDLALNNYERVVGEAYINGEKVDHTKKVDWGKEFDNVTFKNGRASEVMRDIQETIDDDNDLASVIDEDFEDRTDDNGEEVITPEQAKVVEETAPENDPEEEFKKDVESNVQEAKPAPETPVEPILKPSNPVSTTTPPVVPPEPPKGPVGPENTTKEGPKRKPYKDEYNDLVASGVIDTGWANVNGREALIVNINGIKIPFYKSSSGTDGKTKGNWYPFFGVGAGSTSAQGTTADGNWLIKGEIEEMENGYGIPEIQKIQRLLNEKFDWEPGTLHNRGSHYVFDGKAIGGSGLNAIILGRPDSGVLNGVNAQLHIRDFLSKFQTQKRESTRKQKDTIAKLNNIAEQSKKNVKKVTPTHYVIEVDGKERQFPRVHTIMPKYWASDGSFNPALQMGNAFDNLARMFFGDKNNLTEYETNKDALVDRLFNSFASDGKDERLSKMTYAQLMPVRKAFEETIDDLYALADQYDKNGWELSTEPIVWHADFASGPVAGETDMIAVDQEGNVHIIDFKTASAGVNTDINPFGRFETSYTYSIPEELENRRLALNQDDFTVGPRKKGLSKNARAFIRDVRKAKNNNRIKVDWNPTTQQAELKYIDSNYAKAGNSSFRVTHTYDGKVKGSKQDEYSDQLTAYKEMIQRQLGNVVGMEVVGFRVQYSHDGTNVTAVGGIRNAVNGQPFRVMVEMSDEMGNILNVEAEAPKFETPEPDPVVEATNTNEANDQVREEELKKADKTKFEQPEPEPVTPEEIAAAEKATVNGRSNLNDKVLDREHPALVNGIVFDKNFIADAIANGTVEVYTEIVKDRNGEIPSVYVDVTYNGKTYKRIFVYADPTLLAKVQALEKVKQPGQKIVATNISRTKGALISGEVKSVTESGLVDQPVEELEFTPQNMSFGFVKNGNIVAFPNGNTKQQDIIGKTLAPNGTMVYMKRVPRTESEGGDKFIPVAVSRRTLAGDADFIVDCLKKVDALGMPYTMVINGQEVSIGATRKELLDILIPYVGDPNQARKTWAITRDQNIPSIFSVVNPDGQIVAQVDTRSEKSINDFKQALLGVQIVEQNDILASKIGSHNTTPAFSKIKKFFANTKSGAKVINISDNLKFDFDDFKGDGLSGLGWYVKHGVFGSDYAGIGSPKMSINDVGLIVEKPKPAEPTKVTPVEEIAPEQGFDPMDMPIIGNWGGLNKRKTVADADKPLLTKEEIKRRLRPILGDLVDDPTVVRVLDVYANDPRVKNAKVVGRATADAIILYNEAFENVDFHEAFHRIFELFVPKNVRESVYAKAAKQLGIDLSKSTKETDYIGHRQVAEWLADKYMDEAYYKEYTGVQWLDRVLNMIHDFVNAVVSTIAGGQWKLYWTFLEINSGKYRNKRNASKENVDRFNEMFKELNYEIHGTQFDHIVNDPMYEEVKNSAFYCLLLGQDVDVSGATVQNTQISRAAFQRGADRLKAYNFDIFGTEVEPDQKNAAQLAMTEVMVKFDVIADDLAAMMANISTDYRKVMLNEGREDADGGESQSSYDENFFKWSYEFNRFDKTTSRVKFFFATIPDMRWKEDGTGWEFATNSLGLPQLVPMNYVFNEVLSNLWDVDTVEEAIGRLSTLAIDDPMYSIILGNLRKIVAGKDKADNEALLAQLMSTIRSNRHTFMLLRAVQNPEGLYDLIVQRSDADYNARVFPIQWSQVLAKGGSETLKLDKYGNVIFNPNNEHAVHNFRAIAKLFDQLKDAVSTVNNGKGLVGMPSLYEYEDTIGNKSREVAWIEGRYTEDITDPNGCRIVKNLIVEALNTIGINIHTEELDYMLKHKYGSADWEALRQMMQSTDDTDSINSFLFFLDNIVKDGKLNISTDGMFTNQKGKQIPFDNIYSDMAFVKELGNWKYEFRHAHDQLSVLATGGNRFYEMSDNDYMSDVLRDMNKRGKFFRDLKGDPYNYYTEENNFGEEESHGSITIKQLSLDPSMKIALKHFIGFKTDKRGDEGQDYFEISRREDYLSKMGILENGGMISLTLSDKKKYVYISGVKLPGIDYTEINKSKDPVIDATNLASQQIFPPSEGITSTYDIQQREDVIEQMRSYALAEYKSILSQAEKLNDGHRKVVNFDDKEQSVRFSSLLGVWETIYDKEGNATGEQYISFNDNSKSWEENLGIAEAYFFNRPVAEQQAMLQRILTKQAEKELETAEKLGLIETVGVNKNPFLNYRNKGLNNKVIKSLKLSYLERYKTFPAFTDAMAESMAIVAYMNDISNKAIMSGQEMERLFSGNPSFYKWKYNDAGMLVDRTVDELKRLGGLGSTGNNNFTQLDNIPRKYLDKNGKFTGKYVCAEVDNEMVGSSQYEEMKEKMYDGQLRSLIIDQEVAKETAVADEEYSTQKKNIRNNRDLSTSEKDVMLRDALQEYQKRLIEIQEFVCNKVDSKTIEELNEQYSHLVDKAREQADDVADALKEGIDVADGGAYISDTMCEMLLRMEGAYSKEIQEAFKILRGETKADYLSQIDAYQKVLTSVIGTQKYTAFGRRLQNGTSVPYYHKMALFPLFDCIATGKMRNVFDKMKEQGIDMLLVNSAVKVGSEGSKPIDWSDYRQTEDPSDENNFRGDIANQDWKPMFKDAFNFNTYECDFDYLRKQLNTDPKEEQMLRMGTQMQKIVYSNLVPGRTYKTRSGEPIKGHALLDRIMDASNKLSDMGVDKINKRFFVTNENGEIINASGEVIKDRNSNERMLDIEKFSKEVSKQMSERGADKNVLQALELITAENKTKQLSIPLGAISNASWLESVLISMLNKEIVDVNTPGAFFIQRSIWAMQGQKMYDGKKNVKGDLNNRQLYDGKPLKMVNEENSMDCVLSLDFFQHILPQVPSGEYEVDEEQNKVIKEYRESLKKNHPELSEKEIEDKIKATGLLEDAYLYEKDEDGNFITDERGFYVRKKKMRDMTFDEARKWLMRKGIIGDKAKSSIVAYRIPTQAESSIHALRCVDVVPVVRDTVILPEEFTKITGSDFDIDKLGLSTLNYHNGSSEFEAGTEKFYQNQLIEDYLTLLTDPRTQHILHRSIDKDTKLLKDVLADIEQGTSQQEMPYGFYSLSTQTERKDDYITGKIGIGPFALNNNSHILTMLYGVKFREFDDSIMTELGLNDLSGHLDKDGNSIMSWLSALINAHVDIAKDPYISRLNVGPFTYNLVNTLIRTGLGAKTFYFTTQPIMKELAEAYTRAGSSYMADQYKSKYQLQKDAIEQVGKDRFGELKIDGWSFDELVQGISDPKDVKIKPVINNYIRQIFDEGILKTNANRTYNQIDGAELLPVRTTVDGEGNVEKVHFTPMQVQMLMYLAYLQFDPYATSVSNLVKYSKIDTKKHGKSYVEQQVYLKGFKKLFDNKDGGGLFEPEGLLRLAKQSYIELKTINAISMTKNILKGQFLQATNAFDNAIQHVLNMIGKPDSLSVDLWNEISRAITASIKSEFINEYAGALRPGNDTYIHDLVSESEETFEYTQSAKSNVIKLAGKPKYSLKSYMHKKAHVELMYKDPNTGERKPYSDDYTIIGYNDETNELIVDKQRKLHNNGKITIKGGENTIYDRFNRLAVELREDPAYRDILDAAGEPRNMLLRSLVTGKTFDYKPILFAPTYLKPEGADTYETLKFIKLFNALDQNGVESNFIIDAWDELLHDDNHPKLKEFAEDLVVYAFVTSGDQGGFTKFFKQVPFSWRKESGYADFINRKLVEFQSQDITTEQLQDAILNNWHNNLLVPKYNLLDEHKQPNFMAYSGESLSTNYLAQRGYPTILAALKDNNGILEVSIDPDNAPLFIKIPRRIDQDARDSQRRVTVYKRVSYGMRKSATGEWVHYPIYVKVEPKGNLLRGNFLMTEYGREDSLHKEYGPSEDGMKKMFALGDFIEHNVVEEYKLKWGQIFGQMIEDMNYQYLYKERFAGNEEAFVKALDKQEKAEEGLTQEQIDELKKEAEEIKKQCKGK